jgi:hypothetical protein
MLAHGDPAVTNPAQRLQAMIMGLNLKCSVGVQADLLAAGQGNGITSRDCSIIDVGDR